MSNFSSSLSQSARSLGLFCVGVLSTLGILSLTHVGPVQAKSPGGGGGMAALMRRLAVDEANISALQADNAALQSRTAPLSVKGTDLTITGVNVHIVSGSGRTDDGTRSRTGTRGEDAKNVANPFGRPAPTGTLTGLGNLIIGYNTLPGEGLIDRKGSHNLILGDGNSYSSFGGLVAGSSNTVSGPYATISGGVANFASGEAASVSGGQDNVASGLNASVSGGNHNIAGGELTSVSGGEKNTASGDHTSVSGGYQNTALNHNTSVSGGRGLTQGVNFGWSGGSYQSPQP